jgi:hypothetical protein
MNAQLAFELWPSGNAASTDAQRADILIARVLAAT